MYQFFIGIDPGTSGAVAVLNKYGQILLCASLPINTITKPKRIKEKERKNRKTGLIEVVPAHTIDANKNFIDPIQLINWIYPYRDNSILAMEEAHPRIDNSAVSAFASGRNYGNIEAPIKIYGFKYIIITPSVWRKRYDISGAGYAERKENSRQKAITLYPAYSNTLFKCKKDADKAEAVLMAEDQRLRVYR
jgi:hypothetical protein